MDFVVEASGEAELFRIEFRWLLDSFVIIALIKLKIKIKKLNVNNEILKKCAIYYFKRMIQI
jgi:hypothetical protein